MSVQVCPGCQGRNAPQAATCEWCGRPFDGRARGFSLRWWHLATVLLFGFVVVATGSAGLPERAPAARDALPGRASAGQADRLAGGAGRADDAADARRDARPDAGDAEAGRLARRHADADPPNRRRRPRRPATSGSSNTTGIGVFLREEPGQQSQRIRPAIAEGAILRLVGPEQTVQAQIWRLCEHEGRGVQGWVLAQYLQPVESDADADSAIRIQRYIGPVPCISCRAV